MGQLPLERVTPGAVFENVGIDYVYVCIFVSLSVKAIHLETVSDLTTDTFVASLCRFIACSSKPSCICSDHGTNFVGATQEMKELLKFLTHQKNKETI